MPDPQIFAYYERVAEKILPFLRGRRVAVRHTFDAAASPRAGSRGDQVAVFRRHPSRSLKPFIGREGWPEKNWIYIPNRRVLREIVRQHGYEFFPHLEGGKDFWFALDIDVRAVPLPLGKIAVRAALDVLEERQVKYLLKFSGGNGFHLHWAFRPRELPKQKWQFVRRIVRAIRGEVERRLQASRDREAFYAHIPRSDPITELNAVDKEAQHSILFDELILKPNATIRAPFSVHMGRRRSGRRREGGLTSPLVAVPIEPRRLEAFQPMTDATMAAATHLRAARLPINRASLFTGPGWRGE